MKLTTTVWSYIQNCDLQWNWKMQISSHKNIKDSQGQWRFRGIWLTMTRELKVGWSRSCVTDSHDLSYSNRDFRLDSILLSQTRGDWPRLPNFEPCSAECQFGTTSDRLCLDPSSSQQGRAWIQLMMLMQTGLGLNLHDLPPIFSPFKNQSLFSGVLRFQANQHVGRNFWKRTWPASTEITLV